MADVCNGGLLGIPTIISIKDMCKVVEFWLNPYTIKNEQRQFLKSAAEFRISDVNFGH